MHKLNFIPALFLFTVLLTQAAVSKTVFNKIDPSFYPVITDNDLSVVNASAVQSDGKIIVAGAFSGANGFPQSAITRILPDGRTDQGFGPVGVSNASVAGIIYDLGIQTDGKILLGGNFTRIGPNGQRGIARLNADGTFDAGFSFDFPETSPVVNSVLVEPDGKTLIGGNFLSFRHLLRFNADGTFDGSFTNNLPVNAAEVTAIERQPDGKIIVAYRIYDSNWITRTVRFNNDGSPDQTFTTLDIIGTGAIAGGSPDVDAMKLLPDGKILIAGSLTSVAGQPRRHAARLNADGRIDTGFAPDFDAAVFSLALLPDGDFLAGGIFTQIDGAARKSFARLNADGSLDDSLDSPFTDSYSPIKTISLQPDGKIITGGDFFNVGGALRYRVARLNADGTLDTGFAFVQIGSPSYVTPIARRGDGKIFIAGDFVTVNGRERRKLALLNPDGTLDESFRNANLADNFYINDLLVQPDGKLIAGGTFFFFAGGKNYEGFIRFNQDGTVDTTFADRTDGAKNVGAMVLQPDGKIIVGGSFTSIGAAPRSRIARLNSDGTLDETFLNGQSGANSYIMSAALQPDGKVLFGGGFTQINDAPRNSLARLNPDGSLDTTFLNDLTGFRNSSNNAYISQTDVQADGRILAIGNFETVNGTPRKYIARLNSDGSLDNSFMNGAAGPDIEPRSFALLPDGRILIGGGFTTVNGENRRGCAILNQDGSVDLSFDLDFGPFTGYVYSFAVEPGNGLIVGGSFKMANGLTRSSLIRITGGNPKFDFDGDGKTDISIFRPGSGEWWHLRSSDNRVPAVQFGSSTDKIVPADYTGDGRADIAFFRPSDNHWYVLRSEDFSFYAFPFGATGDKAVPANYDGDGRSDAAVFRESNQTWYIARSSGGIEFVTFGAAGDAPVPADYDGDGKTDIAITRVNGANREWWIRRSSDSQVIAATFGTSEDKAVQGDYTGDGKADVAFWRPSTGNWYILRSEDGSFYAFPFGASGDTPTPGDYDGDGRFDAAVYRESNSVWYQQRTTQGFTAITFGIPGDIPIPSAFIP